MGIAALALGLKVNAEHLANRHGARTENRDGGISYHCLRELRVSCVADETTLNYQTGGSRCTLSVISSSASSVLPRLASASATVFWLRGIHVYVMRWKRRSISFA